MHVGGSKIDDNLLSGNMIAQRLEGSDGSQQTFLHGNVSHPYKMDSYPRGDVNLDGHRNGIDADAFGAIDVYQHIHFYWRVENTVTEQQNVKKT